MRLSNIDFPALSTVQLNSLKGGIDGKYPNFGSSIPAAEQIGRVEFYRKYSFGWKLDYGPGEFRSIRQEY